jgi:hypothetical protein
MSFFFPVRGGAVGWGIALKTGRTQVPFRMESVKFFIYIILPAVLWPWDRIRRQPNWVPKTFPRGKGDWSVWLITLPISNVYCQEIWNSQSSGTLWNCNRTVLGMLYLTFSSVALFFRPLILKIWPKGHANFLRSQNNLWVGHHNFTIGMKYFKFKTELKFSLPPPFPALQKIILIYCCSHILSTWICFHLGNLCAV